MLNTEREQQDSGSRCVSLCFLSASCRVSSFGRPLLAAVRTRMLSKASFYIGLLLALARVTAALSSRGGASLPLSLDKGSHSGTLACPRTAAWLSRPVARCLKEKGPDDPFAPLSRPNILTERSISADPNPPPSPAGHHRLPAHSQSRRRSLILVTPLSIQTPRHAPAPTSLYKSLSVISMSPLLPTSLPHPSLLNHTTRQPEESSPILVVLPSVPDLSYPSRTDRRLFWLAPRQHGTLHCNICHLRFCSPFSFPLSFALLRPPPFVKPFFSFRRLRLDLRSLQKPSHSF